MNITAGVPAANTQAASGPRLPWWTAAGVVLLAVGVWSLVEDVPVLNVLWYAFAWYGYLLCLDGLTNRLTGGSPLSDRPRRVLSWLAWSVPFWFVFELYNLRIANWYYVYALRSEPASFSYAVVAFATVLPACFCHAELFRRLAWWSSLRRPRISTPRRWVTVAWIAGTLCCILPVVWPVACFWMVWGALLGIPEAIAYRVGAPSFIRDLEEGRPQRLMTLLAGGGVAGFVWEGLNYWARCKWVYTVPGMEEWKLFEMPVLGFLGFPVLALNAAATYGLVGHAIRRSRAAAVVLATVAVAVTLVGFETMNDASVRSRRPLLSEWPPETASRIRATGARTVEELVDRCREGGTPADLDDTCRQAALALHKGMGVPNARTLYEAGITHVDSLRSTDDVVARIGDRADVRRAEVAVWVRAAGSGPRR